jgi:hypothetical protein
MLAQILKTASFWLQFLIQPLNPTSDRFLTDRPALLLPEATVVTQITTVAR